MTEQKIYPDVDTLEVIKNATKSPIGFFIKQYKKGDFMYTMEKRPFKPRYMGAIHIPTKKVYIYSNFFGSWEETDIKFE